MNLWARKTGTLPDELQQWRALANELHLKFDWSRKQK